MALLRNTKEKNLRSVSFGHEQAERPHSVGREVNDLREDVEVAFSRLEAGTDIPLITSYDATQGFSNDGNSTLVALEGINFLAGRDQASLTLNSLTFSAVRPGTDGNNITITVVKGEADDDLLASIDGNDITLRLGCDNAGDLAAAKNTNDKILTEINTTRVATIGTLITASVAAGQGGASDLAVTAKSSLSGGSGNGFILRMYGNTANADVKYEDLEISTLTDTSITILASGNAKAHISAANVVVTVVVISNNAVSNPIQFTAS